MCSIDKMLIKGIRSFSPENEISITFHKPLTLIVGQNGAGKTTIIECLKMSCTGELPPNVKNGQNFVRDPRMTDDSQVKAQIKLRVYDSQGQPFVITRSMQVIQKKAVKQFKSLDSALMSVNKATGELQSVSHRCADLDKLMPGILGVSKAILENVIFVHQEESYWPMSEGSVLKKKFDDIFAASKHTKIVQEMKDVVKEKSQLGREMKLEVQNLKTHLDTFKQVKQNISVTQEKQKAMMSTIVQLETSIESSSSEIFQLESQCQKLVSLGEQLLQLQTRRNEVEGQTESYLQALGENGDADDSTEDLLKWKEKFDEQMAGVRQGLDTIKNEIDQKKNNAQQLDASYNQLMQKQGRLQAERDSYERNKQDLEQFVQRIAVQVGLQVCPGAQFLQQLEQKLSSLKQQFQNMKSQNRGALQLASDQLSKVMHERGSISEKVKMRKEQLQQNELKMQNLQDEISLSTVGQQLVLDYKEAVEEAEQQLSRKQSEFSKFNLDAAIMKEAEQISELDQQLSRLRQERNQAVSSSEGSARLRLKRQELMQKEEQFQNLLQSWSSRLKSTLRIEELPSQQEIKSRLEHILEAKQQEEKQLTQKIRQAAAVDSQLQGQLSRAEQRLQSQQEEFEKTSKQVQQGMSQALETTTNVPPNHAFQQSLQEREKKHQDCLNKVVQSSAMMKLAGNYKSSGEENNACPICLRSFNNISEKQRFIQHMDQQLMQLPQSLKKVEEKLQKYEKQMRGLKALNPIWLKCVELKNKDIPATMEEIQKLQQQKQEAKSKIGLLEEDMLLIEVEAKNLQNIYNELALPADRLNKEIITSQSQLRDLESTVRVSGGGVGGTSGSSRSVSEVDDDIERCDGQRRKHQENKEELLRKQQRVQDELNRLNDRLRVSERELQTIEFKAKHQEELKKQLEEVNSQNDRIRRDIIQLEGSVAPLLRKEKEMKEEHDRKRQQSEAQEYDMDMQIRELQQAEDQMNNKYHVIRKFEESAAEEELQQVVSAINKSKKFQVELQEQINKLTEEFQVNRKKVDDKEKIQREIEDCLRYRKSKEALEEINSNVVELEERMVQIGDSSCLMEQVQKKKSDRELLMSQRDMLKGSVNTLKAEIQQNQNTMNHPQYKDIDGRYKRKVLEEAANHLGVQDFEKSYKALEKALLQFHANKMANINQIILELWRKTYKGDDIDYIEIQADQESRGRAAYTYRVLMYVQGTQLEMRGRCSTGQKVLACLIIRLALAETFCCNCGVLALDEPTTNLDLANSRSLAEQLRGIIETRQSQESFQLIVITHDKKFAQMISGQDKYAEKLWQVTKDQQGCSFLEQIPLEY